MKRNAKVNLPYESLKENQKENAFKYLSNGNVYDYAWLTQRKNRGIGMCLKFSK